MEVYCIDILVIFFTAAAIMALSFLGDMLSRKVMLPSVILLILLGMLVGPIFGSTIGFDRSSLEGVIVYLAPLTLIFIAFDSGTHMNISEVVEKSRRAVLLSILGFLLSACVIAVFLHFTFSLRWAYSFLLASAWGGVSTATVVAVAKYLRIGEDTVTTLTIASLVDDAIVLVSALTIIDYIFLGGMGAVDISLTLVRNISISFFIGVVVGIMWLSVLHVSGKGGYTYTFTLAAVLLVYSVTEILKGTGAIAVFLFGLILGNAEPICNALKMKVDAYQLSTFKSSMIRFHSELTFILVTFFFTFIGLTYVFTGTFVLFLGLIISILLHATRFVAVAISTWRSPMASDRSIMGFVVGKGAASAIVSTLPYALGLPNTDIFAGIAINVILFTNIISIILPIIAARSS